MLARKNGSQKNPPSLSAENLKFKKCIVKGFEQS